MIKYMKNVRNVKEYNQLYNLVGWGEYTDKIVAEALKHNIYSISAYDEEKIIGYGRIIGDKTIFLYIQDVMVLPEYQNQKIGTNIMNRLLEKITELRKTNPSLRVYLGASLNKEGFYERFGFKKREDVGLGSGMILNSNMI